MKVAPIQGLRAIAAGAVVVAHFQSQFLKTFGVHASHWTMYTGGAGVDLFFVISGFIMVYASAPLFGRPGATVTFLSHRIIRIVPLYWLATTIYLVLVGFAYSPRLVAASYFFVPFARPSGYIQPVVGQGWTLNYEMFFYLVFAVAIVYARRTAVVLSGLALCSLVAAGFLLRLPLALAYLSKPIVLEFALGMLLGLMHQEGVRLPGIAAKALVPIGFLLMFVLPPLVHNDDAYRVLTWGIPATIVTAGAISSRVELWRPIVVVGDSSYALYLFHSFAVRGVIGVASRLHLDAAVWHWPLLAVAVLGAIATGIAIHYAFERPVTKALRSYVDSWALLRPKLVVP